MAGLPIESWILIAASILVGLFIELAYLRAQRARRRRARAEERGGPGAGPGARGS